MKERCTLYRRNSMKLNHDFIIHTTESESMLVPVGSADFFGLVRGNQTFGAILDLLRTDTTEAGIVAALCERFDAHESTIAADTKKALAELRRIRALEE